MRPLALTVLLIVLMGLAGAATGNGAPTEPRTGGTITDARRVSFQALAGLERRGYTVDRHGLSVRVLYPGHECWGDGGCATINRYTGARTVWLARDVVRASVVITPGKRTATCWSFELATHEWLHHALTLRVVYRYVFDGWMETARDGYTEQEYDAEHELIEDRAAAYAAEAERNGRCVAGY